LVCWCGAGVDRHRRTLTATMATFAKPENALKRAEGELLGLGLIFICSYAGGCCCGSVAAIPAACRIH